MIRRTFLPVLALLAWAPALHAQTPLSLADAILRAQARNLDARTAESAEKQAEARITQARAGYLPSVDVTESWQRGTLPVFVFSSLLAQRQFTAANFAIDALNHPDAVNNLRVGVAIEQAVFDPSTRATVRQAAVGHAVAGTMRAVVAQDLAVAVTEAYGAVLSAEAATRAADAAMEAATADLALAQNRRDAGLATEADVLRVEVYLARAREQRIRSGADATVARARLNQVLGEPLDTAFVLDLAPPAAALAATDVAALETAALAARPEPKLASLQEQFARASVDAARSAFLPRVYAEGSVEANGDAWGSRASSWMLGASARLNLFRGFADTARLAEARQAQTIRALEREKVETAVRVDVRVAVARLDAARAAEAVSQRAVAQAHESHRVIRDRYEHGLADVAALLTAAEAVQQAEARHAASRVDITVAAATLTRAIGTR